VSVDLLEKNSSKTNTKGIESENAISNANPKPSKDVWDKLGAVAPIISGVLMFAVGGWFTFTYNQQQLKLQELQTIEKFIPHLMGSDQSKRAAILAINQLTNPELASRFAEIFASPGTVSALKSISESGNQKERTLAAGAIEKALENLAARESKLSEIEDSVQAALDSQTTDKPEQMDDPELVKRLAILLKERGDLPKAERMMRKAIALRHKQGGAQDSKIQLDDLKKLAEMQQALGMGQESLDTDKKIQMLEARQGATTGTPTESRAENSDQSNSSQATVSQPSSINAPEQNTDASSASNPNSGNNNSAGAE
jgi:hypothetical protein